MLGRSMLQKYKKRQHILKLCGNLSPTLKRTRIMRRIKQQIIQKYNPSLYLYTNAFIHKWAYLICRPDAVTATEVAR